MNKSYLLLGSNQGNRQQQLTIAQQWIAKDIGTILQTSSIYTTVAWGKTDQNDFLNQVLLVETIDDCHNLLKKVLEIEQIMGRQRIERWGERIIDIDILFYNKAIIDTPKLVVPHPYLHLRRFTLIPLVELAPDLWHPVLEKKITQLLDSCPDQLLVEKVDSLANSMMKEETKDRCAERRETAMLREKEK